MESLRIKNKYLFFEIFGLAFFLEEALPFLFAISPSTRRLLVRNALLALSDNGLILIRRKVWDL